MTHKAWLAEGARRFGGDSMKWAFVCPVCAHRTTIQDWKDAGAGEGGVAFSCVGRWTGATDFEAKGKGPCNYAGGGLFRLNPQIVVRDDGQESQVFAFAEAD